MTGAGEDPVQLSPIRGHLLLGLIAVAVLSAGVLGWSLSVRLSSALVLPARITMSEPEREVQHLEGGLIDELLVRDGDEVQAGALLARLADDEARLGLVISETRLAEIAARRVRLEAERDGAATIDPAAFDRADLGTDGAAVEAAATEAELFRVRSRDHDTRLRQIGSQIASITGHRNSVEKQLTGLAEQVALVDAELASLESLLEKGLVPALRVRGLRLEAARLAMEDARARASLAELGARAGELSDERGRLRMTRQADAVAELGDLAAEKRQLIALRKAQRARLSRLEIRAPSAGLVTELAISGKGAVLRPAETLMKLFPLHGVLMAEATVPPRQINQLRPGQDVTLRLPPMPSGQTPELKGSIERISPDSLSRPETGTRHFTLAVSIDQASLESLPRDARPAPGTPADLIVSTGRAAPIQLLGAPLSAFFLRAWQDG